MTASRALRDALRKLLVASRALDPGQRPCGAPMSLPHAHALLSLLRSPEPLSVTELARSLHIDRSNVSRLCARMEQLGEVQRSADPTDRRSTRVQLTDSGHQLATQVDARSAQHFAHILGELGESSDTVLDALNQLTDALNRVEAPPQDLR